MAASLKDGMEYDTLCSGNLQGAHLPNVSEGNLFVTFLLAKVRTVNEGNKLRQMRLKLIWKMNNSDTEHLDSSVIFLG